MTDDLRALHAKTYMSAADETHDQNAICDSCDVPYPCEYVALFDEVDALGTALMKCAHARADAEAEVERTVEYVRNADRRVIEADQRTERAEDERDALRAAVDGYHRHVAATEAAIQRVRAVVDDPRAAGGPMYDGYVSVRDIRRALPPL